MENSPKIEIPESIWKKDIYPYLNSERLIIKIHPERITLEPPSSDDWLSPEYTLSELPLPFMPYSVPCNTIKIPMTISHHIQKDGGRIWKLYYIFKFDQKKRMPGTREGIVPFLFRNGTCYDVISIPFNSAIVLSLRFGNLGRIFSEIYNSAAELCDGKISIDSYLEGLKSMDYDSSGKNLTNYRGPDSNHAKSLRIPEDIWRKEILPKVSFRGACKIRFLNNWSTGGSVSFAEIQERATWILNLVIRFQGVTTKRGQITLREKEGHRLTIDYEGGNFAANLEPLFHHSNEIPDYMARLFVEANFTPFNLRLA